MYRGEPRQVIVAATEDSWEHTIVPRLMAAGADLDKVLRIDVTTADGVETSLVLPRDMTGLENLGCPVLTDRVDGLVRLLCEVVLILVDGCFVFVGGEVAEGGVEPGAVVPGDVVDDGAAGPGLGGPGLLVDAFALQRGEERFGDRVVPALTGPADRQAGPRTRRRARRIAGRCIGSRGRSGTPPRGRGRGRRRRC